MVYRAGMSQAVNLIRFYANQALCLLGAVKPDVSECGHDLPPSVALGVKYSGLNVVSFGVFYSVVHGYSLTL